MKNHVFFRELFNRYLNNECSPAEVEQLFEWLELEENETLSKTWIEETLEQQDVADDDSHLQRRLDQRFEKILAQVRDVPKPTGRVRMIGWRNVAAAVAVVAVVFVGTYSLSNRKEEQQTVLQRSIVPQTPDVGPGGNKAVLTLANGTTIALDTAQNGLLSRDGNVQITKLSDGQLAYTDADANHSPQTYNTLTVPRGGQFRVALQDGSVVWLNAASSLRYPTVFGAQQRVVELTGEGYFEVAKNRTRPFIVKQGGVQIEVLGTHFNVNAYADEDRVRTTLVEGSVKVHTSSDSRLLVPGDQAQIAPSGKVNVQKNTDVDAVTAWKNGLFNFNQSTIRDIMNQLARWYDIKVQYSGAVPKQLFGGEMQRGLTLSQVLKILERSGVHFRLENRTLTVMP